MKNLIFVLDVESDGLYGAGFAVGAVVVDLLTGETVETFERRANVEVKNQWVHENVLPFLEGMKQVETKLQMRQDFWDFYMKYRDQAEIFSDFGAPVESKFFKDCIADDFDSRQWLGPYPLHDVASVLWAYGVDTDINREEYTGYTGAKHNPLHDSITSAKALIRAMKEGR